MTQNTQFLQDFQDSMNKLNGMNELIQNSLKQKKEFSDNLVIKLKNINQKINDLAGEINKIKATIDGLQGQTNTNSTNINDKDKQIAQLTQRINELENEKQQIAQQLTDFQQKAIDEKNTLQQQIDNSEELIRKLTEDNTAIKNQANALTTELAGKGDIQTQHAEQIKTQTEEFQQQFEKQQQSNQSRINELMDKIKDCDDKMLDLQKQLKDKGDEAASHAQSITDTQNQGQSQIEQFNQQITQLKNENNDLVQRIISATQAIKQATDNLEILANSVPNQQSEQYINQLFSEIEQSIQNISGVIQGKPISEIEPISEFKPNDEITIIQPGGQPQQVQFKVLLQELKRKSSQQGNVQKYKDALQQMRQAKTIKEIQIIMSRNNIVFRNNAIMGGKKTKKNKKQKGGFSYKINTKRRSITTNNSSSRRTNK
jgi:chromosome segregation ATPase